MWNLIFLVVGVIFQLLLLVVFLTKKVVLTKENKAFASLIIINSLLYCIEIPLQVVVRLFGVDIILVDILCKLYLVAIFTTYAAFFQYSIILLMNSKGIAEKKQKLFSNIHYTYIGLGSILLLTGTFKKFWDFSKMYITGQAVDFLKFLILIYMVLFIILICLSGKLLKNKKFIPIIINMVLFFVFILLVSYDPSALITNIIYTFISYTIFFTNENPDIKLITDFTKNKELATSSIEEKSNIMFKISQDVKKPISEINDLGKIILNTSDINELHKCGDKILTLTDNINDSINNVFNISTLDRTNIKIVNQNYDFYNLMNQIIRYSKQKENNVIFKYSVSDAIPQMLKGDSSRLKQILISILYNSFKYTKKGYVDFDAYSIVKYDLCRLVFTITDTGSGIQLDKINDIMENSEGLDEKELAKETDFELNLKLVKKIVDMQGGSLLISSSNEGTTVTVVLDQLIEKQEDYSSLNETSQKLSNKDRILLIDDDYRELDDYSKNIKKHGYEVNTSMFGSDSINKLNNKEIYKYIFIDDELTEEHAIDYIKQIKDVDKNIKVIVMLEKAKESIRDHYLKDYDFDDYLLKDDYQNEFKRILDKKD